MENFCKRYSVFFIFIILALAVFFRLYQLTTVPPGLYPDEAMNGNNALEAIKTGDYKIFYPENNGREGLFINIQAQSIKIFGNEPWALRIVSAIFGILTVLGLYLLTRELFQKESIALFASFFLAVSFWHINFSRIGFRAIMAPFFLVWSLYFLFLAIRREKSLIALFAGLIFGLGFYSYIAYRIAPILLVPPFLLLLKKKKIFIILFFIIGALITIYPLANYFYYHPQDFFGRTSQISIFSSETPLADLGENILKTIGMFFWQGDKNWRHNIAGMPQLWWPISALFLIGIIVSTKFEARNPKQIQNTEIQKFKTSNFKFKTLFRISDFGFRILFLFSWLIVLLLPVIISNEGIPHALRAIVVMPVVMIFPALGLDWLIEKIKQRLDNDRLKKELVVLLFVFFIATATMTFNKYFLLWASSPHTADAFSKNYTELGNYLEYSPQDIKKYVIINAEGVDVRGIPMPSQGVMFLTDTFLPEKQKEKNIFYILPQNLNDFIKTAKNEEKLQIFMLEIDPFLRQKISDNIAGIFTYENAGILIQEK